MVKRVGFQIDVDSTGLNRGLDEAGNRFTLLQQKAEEVPNLSKKLGVDGETQEGLGQVTSAMGLFIDRLAHVGSEFDKIINKMDALNKSSSGQSQGSGSNSFFEQVKQKEEQEKKEKKRQRERVINRTGSMATGFATGQPGSGIAGALGSIPFVGGMLSGAAGFAMSAYSQGANTMMSNQAASRSARSTLGISNSDMSDIKSDGLRMGFSYAQTMQELTAHARASGGMANFTRSQGIQRGYGISAGVMTDISEQTRMVGGDETKTQDALVRAIESGNFSRALSQELARASSGLIQQVGSTGAIVATDRMIGMITNMGKSLGGQYARSPQKTSSLLGGIDTGIKGSLTGGDSAVKAQMLYALSADNPDMNHAELLVQAEKGIQGGNLQSLLKQADRNYGNMDSRERAGFTQMFLAKMGNISQTKAKSITDAHLSGSLKNIDSVTSGDTTAIMKQRAREAQSGMGLTQRNLALSENRAFVAQAADPTIAVLQNQQMQALKTLTVAATGMSKAAQYLKNPKQVANDIGRGVGSVLEPFMKTIDSQLGGGNTKQVKYSVVPGQRRKGSH